MDSIFGRIYSLELNVRRFVPQLFLEKGRYVHYVPIYLLTYCNTIIHLLILN
uniref:Uncharacterized protein n=1 Tax=Lepeophtheirus salmonis TaxID=72036 RepID=A0A0K2TK21_LEPSM